jgi:sulfatase modifying factor 1
VIAGHLELRSGPRTILWLLVVGFVCITSACGARTSLVLDDNGEGSGACGWGQPCCKGRCATDLSCSQGTCIANDAGPPPPSCAAGGPGLANCGVTDAGGDGESCCTSLEVPAGTYFRTYTNDGNGPTGEADPATVSGFRLDKYEVTVGRFRQFLDAWEAGWRPAAGSGIHVHLNGGLGLANVATPGSYEIGWAPGPGNPVDPTAASTCPGLGPSSLDRRDPNLPIDCIDWSDAYAFCIWDGGFLPSEAEWEYAAAGGGQQREYPWGTMAPGTRNLYAVYACSYPDEQRSCAPQTGETAPTGITRLGAARWGHLDMAGNVYEWNLDFWNSTYVTPSVDGAYLTDISGGFTLRVLRGGSFDEDEPEMVPPARNLNQPIDRATDLGVRCARTP